MKHPLVGQFFHSFRNEEICWQGQIKAVVEPGFYLCRFNSWVLGEEVYSEIVTTQQMVDQKFRFYDNEEFWRSEGDRLLKKEMAADQGCQVGEGC